MVVRPVVKLLLLALAVIAAVVPGAASATHPSPANPTRLLAGLAGGSGSAVGPDGALYVTERNAGRVSRVDPKTGAISTFASGLPLAITPAGGAVDIAFAGRTAYVLVTMVGPDLGGSDVVGIYRVDGPQRFTVVADIGAFSRPTRRARASSCRRGSSTPWSPTVAVSSSPMGTTTGCCGSRATARSQS